MTNPFRQACCRRFSTLLVLFVASFPSVALAQSAVFGSPVVKTPEKYAKKSVQGTSVVPKLGPVTKTQQALAAITASQASGAQVVTLPYATHKTYVIPVRPGMFTTLSLPKDEPISQFAVSTPSAVQLHVDASTNTAMVKLVQSMTVIGTIITPKHIFYLKIVPAGESDVWYQGVNWSFGTDSFGASTFGGGLYAAKASGQGSALAPYGGPTPDPVSSLYSGQPNFDYTIEGDAPFQPQAVWDNGRFTWIQFPKNLQQLPAVFVVGPNGLEIVNYTVHNGGTQILVNRLMPHFLLKIGKAKISVEAKH